MNKYLFKMFSAVTILALMLMALPAQGALAAGPVSLTALGTAYTQNFDTLPASGSATWTNNSTIPGWFHARTGTGTTIVANDGGSNAGNLYSYGTGTATDRALGSLGSGNAAVGDLYWGVRLVNDTGSAITSLDVSYTGEQWRAGGCTPTPCTPLAQTVDFQYQVANAGVITNVNTPTTGWLDHDLLDFTSPTPGTSSTGTALDGNAAANRTNLSSTISLTIAAGQEVWLRWRDINHANNDHGLSIDDFSVTPQGAVTQPNLSINDVSTNEGNSGTTSFDFTVNLSAPAGAGGVTFDIATADNTATVANNDYAAKSLTGQTIVAGSSTYTFNVLVNGDTTAEPDETFFVNIINVTGATVADGQGQGTIVNDDVALTLIHDIQGSGPSVIPGTYTVEAIVVGDYQTQGSGQLRGFFIQEEDSDVDLLPATSEGIFVFCSACPTAVSVGDKVRVTGAASEFFDMSQLSATTAGSVSVISSGNPLPTTASVQLPVTGVPTGNLAAARIVINAYFETFEGMLVTFPDTLSVREYFELARYGQVILSEGGRPRQFTDANMPDPTGFINHQIDLASRTIILDDTDNRQNRPVDTPNTAYYHPVPGLNIGNFFRGGDTITNLTGVLHWSFAGQSGTDAWRIRPVTEAYTYAFTPINTRPAVPSVGGSLKVASFNVLNYFLTIDTSNICAPTQNQDCRGADSAQELERQRTKMLAALAALDADVFGFMEMENTPDVEPLADIVAGLPGYDYIDTGVIGGDAIRVGIIYKTSAVQPVGAYAILDSSVDPRFIDTRNRPALAQTFMETTTSARFTVVVNHLKSKGSGCGAGDDDTTTGQGNCNYTRTLAAQALADWLATDPTGSGDSDVLIIGDLNSYAKEDPIVALQNAGYTDMVAAFGAPNAYGYVFDGQLGYLDHALASSSLNSQVANVAEWHINADEIPLFDYNDDVRSADEATFEEESDTLPLYEPNQFRTSDHDPVIVGLNLNASPVANPDSATVKKNTSVAIFALANDFDLEGDPLTVISFTQGAHGTVKYSTKNNNFRYTPVKGFSGTDSFTYTISDGQGGTATATVTVTVQ
jgi:hypothetical protein